METLTGQCLLDSFSRMAVTIDTPVQFVKGVGPKLGDLLRKKDILTVGHLLEWYPRAYEDRRAVRQISTLIPEQLVSLKAQVLKVRSLNLGRTQRKIYEVVVGDQTGRISCKYFRVPYRGYFERFQPMQEVRVVGKVTLYKGVREFHHPDLYPISEDEETKDELAPIYVETEGLTSRKWQQLVQKALGSLEAPEKGELIPDRIPKWVREKYNLLSREKAVREIHQPPAATADQFLNFTAPAQRRIIFEEFFWLELSLATRRAGLQKEHSQPLIAGGELAAKLQGSLSFALTQAQLKAFAEITADLKRPFPMHRLVQGDVGSGKTLVAFMAALYAIEAQAQVAFMAPTEILAEQHFKNATKLLAPLGVRVALLTSQTKTQEYEAIMQALKAGAIDICIGTHALIQEGVEFSNLCLAIIDEQHRFGVAQRQLLKSKGSCPHFLVMTATPIPRTLAMTVYGDLDVTVIDEMPEGRQPIVTRKAFESQRSKVMGFLKDQIASGRQAYVVCPLVEESEKIDLKNAQDEYEKIKAEFPQFKIGLIHGRMKAAEKDAVMNQFRLGELQVLVATTVIEVGVDVPNANFILLEQSERFGLSQLHQLRGRVGRGSHKSYCILMLGYAVSEDSRKRAEIMESTTDGFKISEADLELRGPGEFLGTRQSGLPGFKMANLVRDIKILQEARAAAFALIEKDPTFAHRDHAQAREAVSRANEQIVG